MFSIYYSSSMQNYCLLMDPQQAAEKTYVNLLFVVEGKRRVDAVIGDIVANGFSP